MDEVFNVGERCPSRQLDSQEWVAPGSCQTINAPIASRYLGLDLVKASRRRKYFCEDFSRLGNLTRLVGRK